MWSSSRVHRLQHSSGTHGSAVLLDPDTPSCATTTATVIGTTASTTGASRPTTAVRATAACPRPALPGRLAELGDDAWDAVDLALAELADRRALLIDALAASGERRVGLLADNLRRHAHTVRGTAALLGDDVVVCAATALENVDPAADVAGRVQRLVDAIGRMIVCWSPIEDASLERWLAHTRDQPACLPALDREARASRPAIAMRP